ncbi:MAG: hypothetical protein V7738_16655 [Dietzia maris]
MPWTEDAPARCPRGHPLGPDQVLVGWQAPRAGTLEHGWRAYECRACGEVVKWTPTRQWN